MNKARPAAATDKPVPQTVRFAVHIDGPIREGGPTGKLWRADDAIGWLLKAFFAPEAEQRRMLLEQAMLIAYFGSLNEFKFIARGDRRGRPRRELTAAMVEKLRAHPDVTVNPTGAAKQILRAHGFRGQEIKGSADYLVRQLNKPLAPKTII